MPEQNKQLNINVESAYLYKKTEKLVSALYLFSNFLSDKEPIKWQLREIGISLLSANLSVKPFRQVLSLLEVSYIGGLISEMNFNIFKCELESLIRIAESETNPKAFVLAEQFFNMTESPVSLPVNISKGQDTMSNRMSFKNSEVEQKDKSNRQDIIIGLLKKSKELGIKDFTSSIKGCSEKTIQRELASLVSKGLIKKVGEKRWSRYSIK